MAKMYLKSAKHGGEGGSEWDDGVYHGVTKISVGNDIDCSRISYIKFEYVKVDGNVITSEHGKKDERPGEFVLEYPDEHIIAVEGTHDTNERITSLAFKTSKGRKSPTFGPNRTYDEKFVMEDEGRKIIGFHGRSGDTLDALGVYFEHDSLTTLSPLYKLDAQGNSGGHVWDDGIYDGVKTVRIGQDDNRITYLEFEYEKGGKTEIRRRGVRGETISEFVLDYPNEYIKSVEATYHNPSFYSNLIVSLSFKTSKE